MPLNKYVRMCYVYICNHMYLQLFSFWYFPFALHENHLLAWWFAPFIFVAFIICYRCFIDVWRFLIDCPWLVFVVHQLSGSYKGRIFFLLPAPELSISSDTRSTSSDIEVHISGILPEIHTIHVWTVQQKMSPVRSIHALSTGNTIKHFKFLNKTCNTCKN